MIDWTVDISIIVGAIIGVVTGFLGQWLRWKYIESKETEKNRKLQDKKSTIDYYRNNFDHYAPFLAILSEFDYIGGGSLIEMPARNFEQAPLIKELLPKFLQTYKKLRDGGRLLLLPNELSGQIFRYGNFLNAVFVGIGEKNLPEAMEDDGFRRTYFELMHIGGMIKESFRIILGSTYMDEQMEEIVAKYFL